MRFANFALIRSLTPILMRKKKTSYSVVMLARLVIYEQEQNIAVILVCEIRAWACSSAPKKLHSVPLDSNSEQLICCSVE
jgi:hypothetical protein